MNRLRTIGIVAHIDAGKTTLTERILFAAGAQPFLGDVDDGTAAADWMRQEQERGISITAAATRVSWRGMELQLIDTPGHVDFTAEVERCMRALDGVIIVLDGLRGVESQTEAVWREAARWNVPAIVFVNKMDRIGADFLASLRSLADRLGCVPAPVMEPLFTEDGIWTGIGDLLFGDVQWFAGELPPELVPRVQHELSARRDALVETCADHDEGVLADFLAARPVGGERLADALRLACRQRRLVPVLCGSALRNLGVDWLLDAVSAYLPAPDERARSGRTAGEPEADPSAPFCGLVFKVQHVDGEVLNYVRVFAGQVRVGAVVVNARTAEQQAVGEIWAMHVMRHEIVAGAGPGEVVVLPGDLGFRTDDTLYERGHPIELAPAQFSEPVLTVSLEPVQETALEPMLTALQELCADDPTLRLERDQETGLPAVSGMGELHLEVLADRLRERTGPVFRVARPRVASCETVAHPGRGEAEVRATVDGQERRAVAAVTVEPAPELAGTEVQGRPATAAATGVAAALALLRERAHSGLRTPNPARGLRLWLERLGTDPGPEVEPLLLQAVRVALDKAVAAADSLLLEPAVRFEVACPADTLTFVLADLNQRGAEVRQVASGSLGARIEGRARLAALLGYATRLRSMTKGRGSAMLRPDGYEPVQTPQTPVA
jgi:elongation factor G